MPYKDEVIGIYRIFNRITGCQYVGQSRRVKKRLADHFNLLRGGRHPNRHLQNSFKKHGETAFGYEIEVECEGPEDLNALEGALLKGEACFASDRGLYNIAREPGLVMTGRKHSEETKRKISQSKRDGTWRPDGAYRQRLREAQLRRLLAIPAYVEKLRFIVRNPHMTYAHRARLVGSDTGTTRKLFLKYSKPEFRQAIGV